MHTRLPVVILALLGVNQIEGAHVEKPPITECIGDLRFDYLLTTAFKQMENETGSEFRFLNLNMVLVF
jgi:hypothetical protein